MSEDKEQSFLDRFKNEPEVERIERLAEQLENDPRVREVLRQEVLQSFLKKYTERHCDDCGDCDGGCRS